MIYKAGAGPEPIPAKELGVDNLRDAIKFAISPGAKGAAKRMAEQIHMEVGRFIAFFISHIYIINLQDGVRRGVDSFYRHLPLLNMRCDLDPSKLAVWWSTEHVCASFLFPQWRVLFNFRLTQCLKLSAFAAQTLADAKQLDLNHLDPHRNYIYFIFFLGT